MLAWWHDDSVGQSGKGHIGACSPQRRSGGRAARRHPTRGVVGGSGGRVDGVAGSRVVLIDVKAWPEGGRSGPSTERPSMVAVVALGYPRRCDLRSVIMRGVCGDGWRCMRAAQGSGSPGTMADRARVEWGETGFFDGVMQGTRRPSGTCGVAGGDRQCRREVACRDRGHHGVAACVHASWPGHMAMDRRGLLASGPYQFKLFSKFQNQHKF
jgi:hypothetical protein